MSKAERKEDDEVFKRLERGEINLEQAYKQLHQNQRPDQTTEIPKAVRKSRRPKKSFSLIIFFTQLREILFKGKAKPKLQTVDTGTDKPRKKKTETTGKFTNLGTIKNALLDLATVAIAFGIIWILMSSILNQPGYAPGFDTPSHMYITERLAEGLKQNGRLPNIDLSWYSGLEITHKLPPLTYLPLIVIYLITSNAMLTSKIFFLALLGMMALSMYIVTRLIGGDRLGALAAAIVVTFSAASIAPAFSILVSFTRYFAFILFPWALYSAKRLLDGRLMHWVFLGAIISLMFPSHPMVALITATWISVYAFSRIILEHKKILFFRYFIYAFALSALLAGWYLGPFLVEEPVWGTTLPRSIAIANSMPLGDQLRSIGVIFALAVAAVMIFRFSVERLALLLASLFGFVYALGVYGPVTRVMPSLQSAYPFIAFFCSIIGLAFLIFTSFSLDEIKVTNMKTRLTRVGVATLVLLITAGIVFQAHSLTNFTKFDTLTFAKDEIKVNARLRREQLGGRVLPLGPPYGLEVQALPLMAERPTPEGQYTTIAPFYIEITELYDDIRKGYLEAAWYKLRRWDVNFVLITPFLKQKKNFEGEKFDEVLKRRGFKQIYKNSSFTLLRNERPTSYIQNLKTNTLIVGKFAAVFSALYPDSVASDGSTFIDDYTLDDLKNFKVLVLYGFTFRNRASAERLLKAYVSQGGQVIIDMQSGDEFSLARKREFLGVNLKRVEMSGKTKLRIDPPNSLDLPELDPVTLPAGWQTVYYRNLDRDLVTAINKGRRLPLVGYKKIGPGKVYFIGGNLVFHAFDKHHADLALLITKIRKSSKQKTDSKAKVKIDQRRFTPEKLIFNYKSNKPWPVLISRTYSPHWQARLDGKRDLEINKLEGLMEISLPKGRHQVTLDYGPTFIHPFSKFITFFGLILAAYILIRYRRKRSGESNEEPS